MFFSRVHRRPLALSAVFTRKLFQAVPFPLPNNFTDFLSVTAFFCLDLIYLFSGQASLGLHLVSREA